MVRPPRQIRGATVGIPAGCLYAMEKEDVHPLTVTVEQGTKAKIGERG